MDKQSYLAYRRSLVEEVKKQCEGYYDEYLITYVVSLFLGTEEDTYYLTFTSKPVDSVASSVLNQMRKVEEEERIKEEKRLRIPYNYEDKGLFHQEDVWE